MTTTAPTAATIKYEFIEELAFFDDGLIAGVGEVAPGK